MQNKSQHKNDNQLLAYILERICPLRTLKMEFQSFKTSKFIWGSMPPDLLAAHALGTGVIHLVAHVTIKQTIKASILWVLSSNLSLG